MTLAGGGRNPQDHPTSKWGWQCAAPQSRHHSNSGSLGQEGLEGLGLSCFPLIQPTQQGLEKRCLPCVVMDTLSKSWWSGSFQVSKFHLETCVSPYLPMYLLAKRETRSFHSNTCCLSSKSVKYPEGLPMSSNPGRSWFSMRRSKNASKWVKLYISPCPGDFLAVMRSSSQCIRTCSMPL